MGDVVLARAGEEVLSAGPTLLQAALVVALVGLVTAREALRQRQPVPPLVDQMTIAVRVLTPVVVVLLLIRLLVILQ